MNVERYEVDSALIGYYAAAVGRLPEEVIFAFHARKRKTCKLTWHAKVMGYECSSCKRITRSSGGEKFSYCPRCGAIVEESTG